VSGKIFYQDVYEVSRNADTERPLQENIGTPMKRNVLLPLVEINFFARGKIFEQLRLAKFFEQDSKSSVVYKTDNSLGMERMKPLRKMRWASRTSLMMDLRLLAKDT
jgi:peptide methionine sulfoxide reductase MsrB